MIDSGYIKKIRNIEITTGKIVNEIFAGEYKSVFRGRGMEFSEVRDYQSGDDIKTIDWNVSARYGSLFVKKYVEERELTLVLLLDVSGSQVFGTQKSKIDTVAELAGVLGFSAMQNNDRIGVILFSDKIEKFLPPKKGRKHCLRIIREVLTVNPGAGTDVALALEYLNRVIRKRAVVFVISDFFDSGYETPLRIAARKHDVVLINVGEPMEYRLPGYGIFRLIDAETGREIYVDARDYFFIKQLQESGQKNRNFLETFARRSGLDILHLHTTQSYILPLINFFKMRARRFR